MNEEVQELGKVSCDCAVATYFLVWVVWKEGGKRDGKIEEEKADVR